MVDDFLTTILGGVSIKMPPAGVDFQLLCLTGDFNPRICRSPGRLPKFSKLRKSLKQVSELAPLSTLFLTLKFLDITEHLCYNRISLLISARPIPIPPIPNPHLFRETIPLSALYINNLLSTPPPICSFFCFTQFNLPARSLFACSLIAWFLITHTFSAPIFVARNDYPQKLPRQPRVPSLCASPIRSNLFSPFDPKFQSVFNLVKVMHQSPNPPIPIPPIPNQQSLLLSS
jgi:hypothetical protein